MSAFTSSQATEANQPIEIANVEQLLTSEHQLASAEAEEPSQDTTETGAFAEAQKLLPSKPEEGEEDVDFPEPQQSHFHEPETEARQEAAPETPQSRSPSGPQEEAGLIELNRHSPSKEQQTKMADALNESETQQFLSISDYRPEDVASNPTPKKGLTSPLDSSQGTDSLAEHAHPMAALFTVLFKVVFSSHRSRAPCRNRKELKRKKLPILRVGSPLLHNLHNLA